MTEPSSPYVSLSLIVSHADRLKPRAVPLPAALGVAAVVRLGGLACTSPISIQSSEPGALRRLAAALVMAEDLADELRARRDEKVSHAVE